MVKWVFNMFDPDNQDFCKALVHKLRDLGMEIWTMHLPYGKLWDVSALDPREREQIIQRHVDLLKIASEWEIHKAVLHLSFEPIPDYERKDRIEACKDALNIMAAITEGLNIQLAVEDLPRMCIGNSSGEIRKLNYYDSHIGL